MVWPAGLAQLLLDPARRVARVGIWSAIGVAETLLYFAGYERPSELRGYSYLDFLAEPVDAARVFLLLVGGSLSARPAVALPAGVALLAAWVVFAVVAAQGRKLQALRYWISLAVFAFAALASILAGRWRYGSSYALESRYATVSLLAVVGLLVGLAKLALEGSRAARVAALGVTALALVSVTRAYQVGLTDGPRSEARFVKLAHILRTYRTQPDAQLSRLYRPTPKTVRRLAPVLEQQHLNVFAHSPAKKARATAR